MVKTKKKEVQKQGLRPSQKAKAEKLRQKQEAKKAATDLLSVNENEVQGVVSANEVETLPSLSATTEKKTRAKVAISLTKDKKIVRKAAPVTTTKKTTRTTAKKSAEEEQPQVKENEALATITVKNAEGDPDTIAEILIQNKIDYTPKVSVIIPVYNVELYLRECLDSVINQTLKEIEIICVDDGSTDSSLEILKEYAKKDNRITVITQKNAGSGKARNNGINNANGEFIAFMDSDDMYPSEKTLEHMYKAAIENDVLVCGGSLSQLREGGKIVTDPKEFEEGYSFKEDGLVKYSDYQFDYGYWRFIYNREFLKENQLYFPDYLRQQDPPFFVKTMATAEKFYALAEPTYVYRVSYKQISWNERKTVDMFKGVADCLMLSSLYGFEKLHCSIVQRINAWTYRTAATEMLTNDKVVDQIAKTLNCIDYNVLQKNDIELILDEIYNAVQRIKDRKILVSIIVPVYNVENYLAECLDSLLVQTLKNIEIICVNDGSTDNSSQILQEYAAMDNRIIIVNQKNQGLPNARNSGIAVCRGLYFTFVDSDDWIDNNYIEEMYKKCVQYNADIAKSGYKNHYESEITDDNLNALINEKCKRNELLEPYENNIISCATMYKYDFLKQHNILYFDKNILKHEDILYTLQVNAYANKIVPVAGVFYHYRRTSSILSIFKYENCYNIPNITSRALAFINAEINDKNNYVRQAQRLVWRMLDTYEKLKDFEQFKNDEKEYLRKMKYLFEQIKYNDIVFAPYIVQLERIWGEVKKIIVSLTSYPARISFVADTVKSLLNQSIKPDKIILNLGADKFIEKEKDLPEDLLSLLGNCFQINWMEHDLRSFSKLIPTLEKFPDDIIVTADDDIIYDHDWLKILMVSYLKNRKLIHCHRVHKISMNKGHPDLYKEWSFALSDASSSFRNFLTGVGGVLYPPHCLYKDVFRKDLYMSLCPKADDIWFWAMAILNGTKIKVVENAQTSLKTIEGSQDLDTCLWKTNLEGAGENDKQLQNVIKQYPRILKILRYDNDINYFSAYVLFPYYRLLLPFLTKKSIALSVKKNISMLQKFRIDVKNCGNSDNNIRVLTQNVSVSTPKWFSDKEGSGKVFCGSEMQSTIKFQAINDGKLVFDFRGNDEKYLDMRIPIWIDYKSIKINDNEILSSPIATWHDKPYHYEMPVKNGQEIILKVEQQHHEYTEDELQDILFKLSPNSEYIKQHMDVVLNELKAQLPIISEEEYKRRQFENTILGIISDIVSYRIDIRNIGTETNNTQIFCDNGKIAEPKWLSDEQGIGKMIQGNGMNNTISVKAIGDGLLKIYFRGQDRRFEEKRFPVWVDYKSIKIDGKEVLSCPVATWHDEPYICEIPVKNGQEVVLDFEQQYHEYTEDELEDILLKLNNDNKYVNDNINTIISELKHKLPIIDEETKRRRDLDKYLSGILSDLTAYRLDIKNIGAEKNNIEIEVSYGRVEIPQWFTNNEGIGKILQGNSMSNTIRIKVVKDGILKLYFRGQDKKYNGERIPLWIDYKSIKIDGKEILSAPVATWHDKPYRYEMPVKDGQVVTLEVEQQYHRYTEDELKGIVLKLGIDDSFIAENIDEIVKRVSRSIGKLYSANIIDVYPHIEADCFVPIGEACRPAYWLRENSLRYCSLPFDWMMNFSLSTVLSTLKDGVSSWFEKYEEDINRKSVKFRHVKDIKNGMISLHSFPVDETVDEYKTEFMQIFRRRYERMKNILATAQNICFLCNRNDSVYDLLLFLREIAMMYPKLNIYLINVRYSSTETDIKQYDFENITIYDTNAYDIHKNGNDKSTNPYFWIGNEDLWNKICKNLSLSEKIQKEQLNASEKSNNRNYLDLYQNKKELKETKYTWDYVKNNLLTQEPQKIRIDNITEKTCGLLQIAVENTKFESVLIPSETKKLYVFLSSGGRDVRYPIFHRIPTIEHYNGTCVFFDDPTRNEINDNGISWYLGGKGEYINYLTQIIRKISESHDIESSNITLIGSSNAGFAVLQMANKLSGVKCIALNPQLSVFLHMGKKARDAFEKKIGMSFSDDKYHDMLYADKFLENNNSKIFLFMNRKSTLDEVQIAYLQELLGEVLSIGFNKVKDNIFCEIVDIDAPNPHNVVPNEIYTPIIDKIMDEDVLMDIKKEVCNAIAEEMKQYYAQAYNKDKDSAA